MRFLPDSNVVIRFLQNKLPDRSFLESLLGKDELFISPVVIAEVRAKAGRQEQDDLVDFVNLGTTLYIDEELGYEAGRYRQQYLNKTKEVYLLDCFIAATCKLHNLTLVTNNVKDYPMKDIKILKPSIGLLPSLH